VSEQLAKHDAANAPKPVAGPPAPRGMGSRGGLRGGRPSAPPPGLLMVGVVDEAPIVKSVAAPAPALELALTPPPAAPAKSGASARGNGGKTAAKKSAPAKKAAPAAKAPAKKSAPAAKKAAAKAPAKTAAKKSAKR
jgi:hypothetical protein